jgi:hypothetical protein
MLESKAVPLRHAGAQREKKYSSTFLALALDGGEWVASRPGSALPPGRDLRCKLDKILGGAQRWNPLYLLGIESRSSIYSQTLFPYVKMYKTAVFMFCAGEDEQRLSASEEVLRTDQEK